MSGFGFTTIEVVGGSMEPTLRAGDVCVVRKTNRISVGDVIVALHPDREDFLLVKRAIRRDGDTWWIEGDNATSSDDSRLFGPVPRSLIFGKVIWTRRRR